MGILLGDLYLDGFEAAAKIQFGGKQRLAIHRALDGSRIIDAMGPDDNVISWRGYLSGSDASDRARALDDMRSSGSVVSLNWDVFTAQVLVSSLQLNFQNGWWIAYSIGCTVLSRGQTNAAGAAGASVMTSILSDLGAAAGPGIDAALAALSVSGATVAGSQAAAYAQTTLAQAQMAVATALSASGSILSSSDSVNDLVGAAQNAATLASAAGYLGRASTNFLGALA